MARRKKVEQQVTDSEVSSDDIECGVNSYDIQHSARGIHDDDYDDDNGLHDSDDVSISDTDGDNDHIEGDGDTDGDTVDQESSFDEEAHNRLVSQARDRLKRYYENQQSSNNVVNEKTASVSDTSDEYEWKKQVSDKIDKVYNYFQVIAKQQDEARRVEEYNQSLKEFFNVSAQSIRNKYRDFDDATNYIYNTRSEQLSQYSDFNPSYETQQGRDEVIAQEMRYIISKCAENGTDPAEAMYSFAKKLGYNKSKESNSNYLDRMNSNRASNKTLTASSGSRSSSKNLLEAVEKMSEDEFQQWYSIDKNKKLFDSHLMGY